MLRRLRSLRFATARFGLLGWTGLALAGAALAYVAVIIPQRNAQAVALQGDIAQWQQRRAELVAAANAAPTAAAAIAMPTLATMPAALLTLRDIAKADNLVVSRNDYRYVDPEPSATVKGGRVNGERSKLVEVRITLPASGSYANLRAFLAHALEQLPSLVLDEASLKRDSIASGALQAQLRFTLLVRRDS